MSKKLILEILEENDEVIGYSDSRIAVKKTNGDVEIITIYFDDQGVPRVDERTVVITRKSSRGNKISIQNVTNGIEAGSF
ncbi:hypothetical protein [Azospirillum picis]|uniref:Uncharacterized protein n=1 Tax=Azospirillum picis TaxID=488438 RepID=A0ABU0MV61_9PROT|nr:hypothetical protein [Azospirillum picis]MBP2303501.1 hypothetical protein [Azospirillum picis]MDQ0537380.1 hypothetical protein [Azospirillum picis]